MVTANRTYRMGARAESARETASRIVDAAIEVFWEAPTGQVSLVAVAERAGVTKQTVLRHFGSKAGLMEAAAARATEQVRDAREAAEPGDVAGAVAGLVTHYERDGDGVLRLLAEEMRDPSVAVHAQKGREHHAAWCERMFPAALEGLGGAARERRLAQLVAVTDVYVWKLLRRDRGLSRKDTELAIRGLLEPITGGRQ